MKIKQLLGHVRRAVDDYNMIEAGDKIAVGISGGKDSLTLLLALKNLQRFYPKKFEIVALTVELGFPNTDFSRVENFCKEMSIEYKIVRTNIGKIIFDDRKEKNPCSLCSKMRKGAINAEALKMGCNKIAYGHNKDDAIETLFMSLFYEGRISNFSPVTYLDRSNLTLIRPLLYISERAIIGFSRANSLPIVKSPCPVDGLTKREETKMLVAELSKKYSKLEDKVFSAILNSNISGWNRTKI